MLFRLTSFTADGPEFGARTGSGQLSILTGLPKKIPRCAAFRIALQVELFDTPDCNSNESGAKDPCSSTRRRRRRYPMRWNTGR